MIFERVSRNPGRRPQLGSSRSRSEVLADEAADSQATVRFMELRVFWLEPVPGRCRPLRLASKACRRSRSASEDLSRCDTSSLHLLSARPSREAWTNASLRTSTENRKRRSLRRSARDPVGRERGMGVERSPYFPGSGRVSGEPSTPTQSSGSTSSPWPSAWLRDDPTLAGAFYGPSTRTLTAGQFPTSGFFDSSTLGRGMPE